MDKNRASDRPKLARRLGVAAATMAGLGVIIGSGIYVIIGVAAGQAGNLVWLSFLVAAFVASLTALSYVRLGKIHPKNAPEYQFVSAAFGSFPAFLAGWLILVAQVVSAAAVALGFAGYLNALANVPELPAALGLILACSLIIYAGIGQSAMIAGALTAVEVLGLLLIVGIGFPHLGSVDYFEASTGMAGVFTAASLVFFAYLGFEGMANLSEEMKDPVRDMPRAIVLALGISALFYLLVAISTVSVLGWNELSQSSAPLAMVAERAMGSRAGLLLSVISLAATGNTALILLLSGSRIAYAMSGAGVLPGALAIVDSRRRTPWTAIVAVGLVALVFVSFKDIQRVAEFTNFITLLAFVAVNASAVKILGKRRTNSRFKHMAANRLLPVLGIAFSLWLAVNAGWSAAVFGLAVLAAGGLVYLSTRLAPASST